MTAELHDVTVHIETDRWAETVLTSVNLTAAGGRITALLGESGCGKSMAAAALTGRLPTSARCTGEVRVNGELVRDRRAWQRLRGDTVGVVPQDGGAAAALLSAPDVLVADEPTASLDTFTACEVWRTLREYADSGAAVLAITQEVPFLDTIRVADRMVFLRDGHVVAEGAPAEIRGAGDPYLRGFFREVGQ